ncbi:DMT family transporter [Asaia prunellae]|uniref:DMT family transporter n=1 Tax=Asaia prunellae TaxID=610245 RepID=UPI000472218A|nr:SMR family transporter [Asaia prunellae]
MAWVILFLAGLSEIIWASAMKQSAGFTRFMPSLVTVLGMAISVALLAWAMKTLPLGTAYMIWTGIGALGAFVVGVVMFGEILSPVRLLAALLILSGVVLMKLSA